MKIIIDINDKEYFRIMSEHDGDITSYLTTVHLYDAIRKNSIPLPKGHGRLIDADYAIKQLLSLPKNELSAEDIWATKVLDLASTIIPADKEEIDD